MKNRVLKMCSVALLLTGLMVAASYVMLGREVAVSSPARFPDRTLIIDAGHGGEDGGAVSSSGAAESHINLAIALRLDAILGLYGTDVLLLRSTDRSLHDSDAKTLREKKVSDLHNRVERIEGEENAFLISIHQNAFGDRRFHGAQVFYTQHPISRELAVHTQECLRLTLDPSNSRQAAKIPTSVYLMNHVTCPAILVECGFLSNAKEAALLQTVEYQTRIASALASAYLNFEPKMVPEGELSQ